MQLNAGGKMQQSRLMVLMGVAGSGKSTVGAALEGPLGATYIDGDDLHPQSNIDKMSAGEPLTDDDRWPWLDAVGQTLGRANGRAIIGCSALKRVYRERITRATGEPVTFIHLSGSREVIADRMGNREGHFMPTSLLDSQFATLEIPGPDENAISVDIDQPVDSLVRDITAKLGKL